MIGIAILGSGAIAAVHADAYSDYPDICEIRAVCDLYAEKAQGLINKKGLVHAKAYTGIDDILTRDDIQGISICLPPNAHAEAAVKALRAGKHVLVEKPMAVSIAECDDMIRAADEQGCILSVVAQNRFKTPNNRVKIMLAEGCAGRVLHGVINSLWWRGQNYYDIWWRGTWEGEGGGCVTSHAVHHLDLLLWMIGKPERVTAVITNAGHDNSECEDLGIAIFEYPGMLVQMTASLVTHDEEQELIFQAERGRLSVPWKTASARALPNGFPENDAAFMAGLQARYDAIPALVVEGHRAQIGNFLRAVKGEEKPAVSGRDGRDAVELIMAIYKAAATRLPVSLPIARNDIFYQRDTMTQAMPHFHKKERSVENFTISEITLGRDVGK
jgi:predicted dehydrogenase